MRNRIFMNGELGVVVWVFLYAGTGGRGAVALRFLTWHRAEFEFAKLHILFEWDKFFFISKKVPLGARSTFGY